MFTSLHAWCIALPVWALVRVPELISEKVRAAVSFSYPTPSVFRHLLHQKKVRLEASTCVLVLLRIGADKAFRNGRLRGAMGP